ncbi:unnamed protein product, partial [Ectocarpus sp. 12 AP-2014]
VRVEILALRCLFVVVLFSDKHVVFRLAWRTLLSYLFLRGFFLTLATIVWTLPYHVHIQIINMVQVPFDLTNTRFKRATGSAYYFRWRRRAGDAMVAGVGLEGNKATRAGSSSEGVMGVIAVTNGVNVLTHQHLNRHSDFFCAVFLLLPDRPSFF